MLAWIVLTRTITIRLPTDMLVSDLSEYHSTFRRCWGEEMGKEKGEEMEEEMGEGEYSNKGPSEIGMTSLQSDLFTRDKIIGPIVSLVRRFHCKCTSSCMDLLKQSS